MKIPLKIKQMICLAFSFLLLLSSITPSYATSSKKIRVAFPQQVGLSEYDGNGNYSGYTYQYLEKIAQITGWDIEYVPIQEKTKDASLMKAIDMVKKGELDLIGGLAKNSSMEESLEYSQNSYGIIYNTLAVKDDNAMINSSNFFLKKPIRVGVRARAMQTKKDLDTFFKRNQTDYEFVEFNLYDELMKAWRDGVVDIVPDVSIGAIKGSRPLITYSSTLFYFASTKGNTALIKELDEAIMLLNKTFPSFQTNLAQDNLSDTHGGFFITDQEAQFIKQNKLLRVLCIPDCAPFVFQNEAGELKGIAISMMDEFTKKTGLKVKYEIYNRKNDFSKIFKNGNYDCVLGIPVNDNYNASLGIITTSPYLSTEQVMFSKHGVGKKDLDNVSIAMLRGSNYTTRNKSNKILYYDTTEECIQAVLEGKVDVGYGNQYVVEYYAQHNYVTLSIVPLADQARDIEFSISKYSNPAFLSMINRYIENIDQSQLYSFHIKANDEHLNNWLKVLVLSDPIKSAALFTILLSAIFGVIILLFYVKNSHKKNRQLQIASNAKSDFLSRVSHDMRTPMNAILSFSSMDLEESLTLEQLKLDMNQIHQSGQYLLGLINDVLDMSKIEHQKLDLKLDKISIKAFIDSIFFAMNPIMEKKHVQFHVNIVNIDTNIMILCDILRTQQIFINLLSNASKFTLANGSVNFTIEKITQNEDFITLRYTIKDTGIGMSEDFQKNMFESFSQEKNEETGKLTGTGLGLAIVKELVDLMDGSIQVFSKQGIGTEFVIELQHEIIEADLETKHPQIQEATASNTLCKKRILLCEDHPTNAQITKRLLLKKDMYIDHAENGLIALTLFQHSPIGYYDAILMDIKMPVMDGITATKKIRGLRREDAFDIPIIALTANAFKEDIEKSLNCGMNAHISKPINPEELYEILMNVLLS